MNGAPVLFFFFFFFNSEFIPRNNNQYRSKTRLSTQIILITTLYSPFLGVHKITKKGEREKKEGKGSGGEEGNGRWINNGKSAGEQGGRFCTMSGVVKYQPNREDA